MGDGVSSKLLNMKAALVHFVMLCFAAAVARLGWYIAHNPEPASRFFTLGVEPAIGAKFAIKYFRILGWFFTVFSILGVVLYLVMLPIDLLGH